MIVQYAMAVTLHSAAATFPAPAAAPSVNELAAWYVGPHGIAKAFITFDFTDTASIAGPVELMAYLPQLATPGWFSAGELNGGSAIAGTADNGWVGRVFDIPAGATALRIKAANPSAGTVTVKAIPVEEV